MSEAAVRIRDLRVDYGDFVAVKDVSLDIPRGQVMGLVGPNGAGKTSTFRVLATLMEPTYGEVTLCDLDLLEEKEKVRRLLGYMPDLAPVPSDLKAHEFLEFHAQTHAIGDRQFCRRRASECLEKVNLLEKRNSWCRELSRGQTQRLVLAKTMLHEPQVMILDEPASGLDPLSRRELRLAVQELARGGVTVLVSSHILSELAEMCGFICVMNEGELLASGSADQVRRELGGDRRDLTVAMAAAADVTPLASWLESRAHCHEVAVESNKVRFTFRGDDLAQAELLKEIALADFKVKAMEERSSTFEEILVRIAEGNRKKTKE